MMSRAVFGIWRLMHISYGDSCTGRLDFKAFRASHAFLPYVPSCFARRKCLTYVYVCNILFIVGGYKSTFFKISK